MLASPRTGSSAGTALVTGAARRIGLVVAERLASAGWDVAMHASTRSQAQAEAEAARLAAAFGVRARVFAGDLADPGFCAGLIAETVAALGPLRLLVNNAALFQPDGADALDLALWDRQFAVNLRAPAILAQHFAAQSFDPRARDGSRAVPDAAIVNMIDQRVLRPTPLFFSYTLTKSALWTATRTMAQTFAERGVRVNAIGPGPVLPNALDGSDGFSREVEGVPLHRAVDPGDIADAVLYLAGARTVTGQMIAVDSGQHLGWRTPDVGG